MQPTSKTHAVHPEVHHHEEPGFLHKYVFSTDHKIIGIQYGVTALLFLFFGYSLMAMMRWQLAYPGKALPIVGHVLENLLKDPNGNPAPGGVMSGDLYNA